MNAIRLFMWDYQHFYQLSARRAVEKLVKVLDKEIQVETFLLGLHPSPNEEEGLHPVCLQPEDCGFSSGIPSTKLKTSLTGVAIAGRYIRQYFHRWSEFLLIMFAFIVLLPVR